MDGWAIDSYGHCVAHSRSILDRIRSTDRLHVSPLTWHPSNAADTGGSFKASVAPVPGSPALLTFVDSDVSRTRNHTEAIGARLSELHDQGVLVVVGDHECEPQLVAEVEGS
jgi:hypothetical protein